MVGNLAYSERDVTQTDSEQLIVASHLWQSLTPPSSGRLLF